MIQYPCPICAKRACDSIKVLNIYKLSKNNENEADIVIKCHNCKSLLAVTVEKDIFTIKQMILQQKVTSNIALST